MSNIKDKHFRIDEDLAYKFEIHAKQLKTSEVKLITRYIKEGMMRDSNQTTLDEELKIKQKNS